MKRMIKLATLAACLAVSSQPLLAQMDPPCSQACCTGEANFATVCSYYSATYGYPINSSCYWWWVEGGYCIQA